MNTIQIYCNKASVELNYEVKYSTPKKFLTEEYNWIFKPLIKTTGSYEGALKKLNWKVIEIK